MVMKADMQARAKEYKDAIETCKKAIEYNKSSEEGKIETTYAYENKLIVYQYQLKDQADSKKAIRWLKQMAHGGKVIPEYYVINAVLESKQADYDLARELLDSARNMKLSWYEDYSITVLDFKIKISRGKKDYKNAIIYCQQALDLLNSSNYKYQPSIDSYEKKISELRELAKQ
jgi:tetratricopeptide (TPR) repeat protein